MNDQRFGGVLLGREREVAVTAQVLADARGGTRRVLLVGGEAGIGKTTLVGSVITRAQAAGFRVLVGQCLDIETHAPFGPFLEAIQPLLAAADSDPERGADLGPATRRLAMAFGSGPRVRLVDAGIFLQDLRQVVDEAASRGPIVLIVEDLHWGDRSTCDLMLALARTAPGGVLLVLTFRTDEMNRSHPFRSALVEIGRSAGAHRLDLPGLGSVDVAAIIERRTGAPADPAHVSHVLSRSGGNPLYVEELLAAGPHELPERLSDLLLSRVDCMSEPTRALLQVAAAGGTRIEPELVGDVAGLDTRERDRLLGEAIDGQVVVRRHGQLGFRHGLLREAIYQDLLPGRCRALHAGFAAALLAREHTLGMTADVATLSQLAFHWWAAGDLPAALTASIRAGLAARQYGAAEAAIHLERALELWDVVPNAQRVGGHAKADLLLLLADVMSDQGSLRRWRDLVAEAVDLLEPDGDRLLASRVYSALGHLAGFGVVDLSGVDESLRLALEYAEGAPSRELAQALLARASVNRRRRRYEAAFEDAGRAVEVATVAGCPLERVLALAVAGPAQMMLGLVAEGIERTRHGAQVAKRSGLVGETFYQQGNLAWCLMMSGDTHQAITIARQGRRDALAAGLPVFAAFCGEQEVECRLWRGELDDADSLLTALRDLGMPTYRWRILRAESLVERGEAAAAWALEQEILADPQWSTEDPFEGDALRQVRLFLVRGETRRALEVADQFLDTTERTDSPLVRAAAARMGFQSLTAAGQAGVDPPSRMVERTAMALNAAVDGCTDHWTGGWHHLHLLTARAYQRRLAGDPAHDHWRAAADAAARLGAGIALDPRLRLAEELLRGGQRDEGRVLLTRVWQSAHAIGARHVQAQATRLATRSRVPLPQTVEDTGPLAKLTPRERDVLEVMATGVTNREIAKRLFISEKTVSVHITNTLAKLGVANRGEAAAIAREFLPRGHNTS